MCRSNEHSQYGNAVQQQRKVEKKSGSFAYIWGDKLLARQWNVPKILECLAGSHRQSRSTRNPVD